MTVSIRVGDCYEELAKLESDSVDSVITSPPYWAMRDYGVKGQLGLEPTLGEHIEALVCLFREIRRVLKPSGTVWLNYGDSYASSPNGRSAADTKAAGNDDRTFRDKPFSTVGPIYGKVSEGTRKGPYPSDGRIGGGVQINKTSGVLKPKDLCMVPNRLAIALQDDGWWVRSEIIWAKPNPMPDSSGKYRPSTAHEKIFLLTKSAHCYYDEVSVAQPTTSSTERRLSQDVDGQHGSNRANGGSRPSRPMKAVRRKEVDASAVPPGSGPHTGLSNASNNPKNTRYLRNYEPAPPTVWNIATLGFKEAHFATFPPELVERCVLAGCPVGGLVLDPFGGAGTTGLVADRLGRDAVLIELNPEYAEIAKHRIEGDAPLFSEVTS